MKQIIVMRNDLGMRKGKMVAQGAHASVAAIVNNAPDPRIDEWLDGSFTKVCVRVDSELELLDVYEKARAAGLLAELITDNGLTEFGGVPTRTCIAVGPDNAENLAPITGHLKLL
ncbi:peptidyl-tRNA hydrolase [Mycobacterium phage WXIN]|nr:peptidyl-tRNA hydrolase [Mycobacterium phage WXIN]